MIHTEICSIADVEENLNNGLYGADEQKYRKWLTEFKIENEWREKCRKWLTEFMVANDMTLRELNNLCYTDSAWVFDQIFGS